MARAPVVPEDSTVFEAVVQALPLNPKMVRIDPRYTDAWSTRNPDSGRLPPERIALRAGVLKRLGIRTTDVMEDAKCRGTAAPPPGTRYEAVGCPPVGEGAYHSVTIGLPENTAHGVVARIYNLTVTPHGSGSEGWEYLFRHRPLKGWVPIKRVNHWRT